MDYHVPFSLMLKPGTLECHKMLRYLPWRRCVVQAILTHDQKKQPVVAKIMSASLAKQAQAEAKAALCLKRLSIPTPALLDHGPIEDDQWVNIFELLSGTPISQCPLAQWDTHWIALIALMHDKGCLQTDPHCDNFFLSQDQVYCLDVATIDFFANKIPLKVALNNLALCLAQLPIQTALHKRHYLNQYLLARALKLTQRQKQQFFSKVEKYRRQRIRRFLNKSLRDCSQFQVINQAQYKGVCQRSVNALFAEDFFNHLSSWFTTDHTDQQSQVSLLKKGRTNTVIAVNLGEQQVVIKRYRPKNWRAKVGSWFKCSRAKSAWLNANRLCHLGILTPQPLAFFEHRRWGMLREGYFVCAFCEGPRWYEHIKAQAPECRAQAFREIMEPLLVQLAQAKLSHGDLKPMNVMADGAQFHLIDVESMRAHRWNFSFKRAHAKDCRRIRQVP